MAILPELSAIKCHDLCCNLRWPHSIYCATRECCRRSGADGERAESRCNLEVKLIVMNVPSVW